jgi:hypothetical protein
MSQIAPETRLWNLIRGALGTKTLGIVADLGVADVLATGSRSVADIAASVGADEDVLYRLLRALASDGVFAEETPRVFRNTEASELLRRGNNDRWTEFAHLWGFACYTAIGELDARGDRIAFARAFQTDFWSWLATHPDERANFDRAMEGGRAEQADRLAALEWRGDETIVDIGGGSGTLLRLLLDRRPGPTRHRLRPAGSAAQRGAAWRRHLLRRRQLLRQRSVSRCVRAVEDPPRLERRAGGKDPADDPPVGAARRAPVRHGQRRAGGQ